MTEFLHMFWCLLNLFFLLRKCLVNLKKSWVFEVPVIGELRCSDYDDNSSFWFAIIANGVTDLSAPVEYEHLPFSSRFTPHAYQL